MSEKTAEAAQLASRRVMTGVSREEYNLLQRMRSLSGQRVVRVYVEDGKPVRLRVIDLRQETL